MKTQEVIKQLVLELEKQKTFLTELDRKIGDADHGYNLALGFGTASKKITNLTSTKAIIEIIGKTLMSTVGGASGPLYGMSFFKAAHVLSDKDHLNFKELKLFVAQVATNIAELGGATLNQKTMLDVWKPLTDFLTTQHKFNKVVIKQKIEDLQKATINMQAIKGRASYLGPRSIGTMDPGAASSGIIISFLLEAVHD